MRGFGAVFPPLRKQFFAYLRQLGILVSLRTQGIVRTLILVFLPIAYAKTVFSTLYVGKWYSGALRTYDGSAYCVRFARERCVNLK